jgi:hypothetical protein
MTEFGRVNKPREPHGERTDDWEIEKLPNRVCFLCGLPRMNVYFANERLVGVRCSECSLLAVVLGYGITQRPEAQQIQGELLQWYLKKAKLGR